MTQVFIIQVPTGCKATDIFRDKIIARLPDLALQPTVLPNLNKLNDCLEATGR